MMDFTWLYLKKNRLKFIKRHIIKIILIGCFILLGTIFTTHKVIDDNTFDKVFFDINKIPYRKVGLVLGTSKYVANGNLNLFYKYRIDAAVKLFENNKIDFILVSGDNSTQRYNEPKKFKQDLIQRGIPEEKIVLDYAGFRTLDSVVRAMKVFGQNEFTVISQKFHNQRAVYLAQKFGADAVGFNAKGVGSSYGLKVHLRERLARIKVFVDLLFNVQPKFLGEPINIG